MSGERRKYDLIKREQKRLARPAVCQACGKPTGRSALCGSCVPRDKEDLNLCDRCPWDVYCVDRVAAGLWVLCEIPDAADMERMRVYEQENIRGPEHISVVAQRVFGNALRQRPVRVESGGGA